jgi:hypothetical protein
MAPVLTNCFAREGHVGGPVRGSNLSRFGRIHIPTKRDSLSIDLCSCDPFLVSLIPMDAAEAGLRVSIDDAILTLLRETDGSQIRAPVVQSVPIDVIHLPTVVGRESKDESMHQDRDFATPFLLPTARIARIVEGPAPLVEKVECIAIDTSTGNYSASTIPQRNKHGSHFNSRIGQRGWSS